MTEKQERAAKEFRRWKQDLDQRADEFVEREISKAFQTAMDAVEKFEDYVKG